jgi:hypothetical protein
MLFLCTHFGKVATQLESKTIPLDDELSILQGIVKFVGLIFLANVPRLWSVLNMNIIMKNYHVAGENYIFVCMCVCVCAREREIISSLLH